MTYTLIKIDERLNLEERVMRKVKMESLIQEFDERGYVVLEAVFSDEEVGTMRNEADRILELIVNSSLANGRKSARLDLVEASTGDHLVRKIQPINDLSLALSTISSDERFLAPLEALMGATPLLMEEKLNYKEPLPAPVSGITSSRQDDRFPVHSDWAYYSSQGYPQNVISSAICIDEFTEENGPIHVWPGSHLEHLEHESLDIGLQVKPDLIDFSGGIDLLAPAGSVLIFHSLLIHNSKANSTNRPRRVMIYSHYPSSFETCFDARNGKKRFEESPYEWEYMRKKAAGEFTDVFVAPRF